MKNCFLFFGGLIIGFSAQAQITTSEVKVEGTGNNTSIMGPVGISTSAPLESLHIKEGDVKIEGYNTIRTLRFSETNLFQGGFIKYDGENNRLLLGVHHLNNNELLDDKNAISIIRSTGNVGINNTGPNYPLDILGTAHATTFSSQSIGINTDAPQESLHIKEGNIRVQGYNTLRTIRFAETDYNLGGFIKYDGSTNIFSIGIHESNDNVLSNDVNALNIVRPTGNIGIHVEIPTYPLHVNGTVRATTFSADSPPWADFVFEDDYSLPSLEEVENFILKNKHLPEIPSEQEVVKNGIDLGAMDAKLLQKIEELVLYTIAQEKALEKKEERILSLEERLAVLEKLVEGLTEK